jgi:hypothetical protein
MLEELFGPMMFIAIPDVRIIPAPTPRLHPPEQENVPLASVLPVYEMFETRIPPPVMADTISAGVAVFTVNCACARTDNAKAIRKSSFLFIVFGFEMFENLFSFERKELSHSKTSYFNSSALKNISRGFADFNFRNLSICSYNYVITF